MKLRFAVSLAALLSLGTLFADTPNEVALPEKLVPSLDTILRGAASQSPRMISRALDLEMAENNRIGARSGMLPSVNVGYRHLETRDDRADLNGSTTAQKLYYDVSMSQPLYFWGERKNTARIGEIAKQMAQGNYREAYRGLLQELRQKYLGLILSKTYLARARAQLIFSRQQLKFAEERLAKKDISELEIAPLRLNVELGQINLERAEYEYDSARRITARLAGISQLTDADIPDAIPAVSYSGQVFDTLLATYLSQHDLPTPEAVNFRKQLVIEDLNVKISKTRLLPKVSVVAGLNQDQQSYTLNTAQKYRVSSMFGGISVNWSIFDGFASQAATRNALLRKRQFEGDYAELCDRLASQAQSQVKQINFSARSMAISDRALGSSEGNVQSKKSDFQRGVVSETEVAIAELQLLDSRVSAYTSRADFLGKVGEFLGTLNRDPAVTYLPSK